MTVGLVGLLKGKTKCTPKAITLAGVENSSQKMMITMRIDIAFRIRKRGFNEVGYQFKKYTHNRPSSEVWAPVLRKG